jgi:branched-chain amino acid transport system substrate-binding protein
MSGTSISRGMLKACVICVACFILSAFNLGAAQAEDLKIAVIGDMSTAGSPGSVIAAAVKLALADARQSGSLTQNVTPIVMDDLCKPDLADAKAREAIQNDHISLAIGHSCPATSIAASEVYREAGILQIDPATTHPALTENHRDKPISLFRVAEREDRAAAIAVVVLRDAIANKRISLISSPNQTIWFNKFQTLAGNQTKGFSTAQSVLDGMTSDVSVIYDPYNRDRDLQRLANTDNVYRVLGPDDRFDMPWGDRDMVKKLIDRLKQEHFEPPFGPAINAYASVQIWIQAMKTAASTEPNRITDQMRKLKFSTIRGPISFDETGDVRQPLITIVRYTNPIIEVPNQCNEPKCNNCQCGCCPK